MEQNQRWSSASALVGDAQPVNLDLLHGASPTTGSTGYSAQMQMSM
jgi:hypothetical protein